MVNQEVHSEKAKSYISQHMRYLHSNEDHSKATILRFQIMTAVQVHNLY